MQMYQSIKRAIADAVQGAKDAAKEPAREPAADGATPTDGAATAPPAPGSTTSGTPAPGDDGRIVIGGRDGKPDVNISVANGVIRITQGTTVQSIPVRDVIPDQAVPLTATVLGALAFIIVGAPIARAIARRMDRRTVSATERAALDRQWAERVAQLERNIDTVAVEVEKLAETQRYTTRLLADRTDIPRPE